MEKEIWKPIPESKKYEISNYGRMRNIQRGIILSIQYKKVYNGTKIPEAYYCIHDEAINNKKHIIRRALSVAVVRAFKADEYIEGKPIYRKDRDIHNNYVDNFVYEQRGGGKSLDASKLLRSLESDWEITGDISNPDNRIKIKHLSCGTTFSIIARTLRAKKIPTCPSCLKREEVLSGIKTRIATSNARYCGRYVSTLVKDRIKVYDAKHKKYFYTGTSSKSFGTNILTSPYDPKCMSCGESMIDYFLGINNIEYYWQYYINDCRDTLPLPFDFGITKQGKLVGLVEYQGEQHSKKGSFPKVDTGKYRLHDRIKASYCKKNGTPLLLLYGYDWRKNKDTLLSFVTSILR